MQQAEDLNRSASTWLLPLIIAYEPPFCSGIAGRASVLKINHYHKCTCMTHDIKTPSIHLFFLTLLDGIIGCRRTHLRLHFGLHSPNVQCFCLTSDGSHWATDDKLCMSWLLGCFTTKKKDSGSWFPWAKCIKIHAMSWYRRQETTVNWN